MYPDHNHVLSESKLVFIPGKSRAFAHYILLHVYIFCEYERLNSFLSNSEKHSTVYEKMRCDCNYICSLL